MSEVNQFFELHCQAKAFLIGCEACSFFRYPMEDGRDWYQFQLSRSQSGGSRIVKIASEGASIVKRIDEKCVVIQSGFDQPIMFEALY